MTKDEKVAYWQGTGGRVSEEWLMAKAYCARDGIAVATLHYWRKRFAEQTVWKGEGQDAERDFCRSP